MRKYQYYNTNDDSDRDGFTANWMSQTFTVETTHLVGKLNLKLFRVGDPGTITVSIKLTSAGKAVGGDLCSGVIQGTDLTLDTNGEWYEISLGDGFTLEAGVQYAIVVKAPNGDASNKVSWRADITDPTFTGGTFCSSSDSGIDWSIVSGVDCMFEEWGVGPPSATAVVWGNLPKSQISAEKIEEAIARIIQSHEDDPDAHIEEGESLQSHKASEIIDHLVESIIEDKIGEGAVTPFKINMRIFTSYFESIDGYTKVGSVVLDYIDGYVRIATDGTDNDTSAIRKNLGSGFSDWTWDSDKTFQVSFMVTDDDNQLLWICNGGLITWRHIGFKVIDNKLYATVADHTTENAVELMTITKDTAYDLLARLTPGEKAEFYVDGVLKTTITENLPTGSTDANIIFNFQITAHEAIIKRAKFSNVDLREKI